MLLNALSEHLDSLAAERNGALGVVPGLIADEAPGWTPAADLAREPYEGLRSLVDETAHRWGAPHHVAAALLWKEYGYWHTLPMVMGWVLARRIPLMSFRDTLVKSSPAGVTIAARAVTVAVLPDDPLAGAPGTVVVNHAAAVIREALLDAQRPLIEALAALTRAGTRGLWGSTAEAIAHTLIAHGHHDEAILLLDEIGPPVAGLVVPEGAGLRRRTCCLWLTLPSAEACPTCCIRRRGDC